jgi:hypothetical protein
LRSLLPKLVFFLFLKTLVFFFLVLTTKRLLVLLKLFKWFIQITRGIVDGILHHLIPFNPKILFIKVFILFSLLNALLWFESPLHLFGNIGGNLFGICK